ncbi:MAG: hypothetical protein AB1752_08950 [Candidatus Zixiibacteriota bacterium]
MSTKRKWIWIYLYVIVAAFAFGFAYDMAYEEALAGPACNCTLWCPTAYREVPAKLWPPNYICDYDPIQCYNCVDVAPQP